MRGWTKFILGWIFVGQWKDSRRMQCFYEPLASIRAKDIAKLHTVYISRFFDINGTVLELSKLEDEKEQFDFLR